MNASNSPPAPRRLNWVDLPPEERFALLRRTESDLSEYLAKAEQIIQAVREEGDSALVRFAQELDKADSFTRDSIRVSNEQITAAPDKLDEEVREAIAFASESIRRFHKDQLPESFWLHEIRQGAFAGERTSPLEQVACYVPRGKGAFPSVFLMTVVTCPSRRRKTNCRTNSTWGRRSMRYRNASGSKCYSRVRHRSN